MTQYMVALPENGCSGVDAAANAGNTNRKTIDDSRPLVDVPRRRQTYHDGFKKLKEGRII
jgi:hypothetical protein